jgi:hypothetical protein
MRARRRSGVREPEARLGIVIKPCLSKKSLAAPFPRVVEKFVEQLNLGRELQRTANRYWQGSAEDGPQ